MPESLWNPADADFNPSISINPLSAGLIDKAIEEIKSIPLLISLVVDYSTNKDTRAQINQTFSDFSFKEAVNTWYESRKKLYSGSVPKIEHQSGKDIVATGTLIASGGLTTVTKIKKVFTLLRNWLLLLKREILERNY